jgi:hypothetical protein
VSGYPSVVPLPAVSPERTGMAEIAWAVWLGCTTPKRLAAEWGIGNLTAAQRLERASRAGWIQHVSRGHYRAAPPRGARDETRPLWRAIAYAAADRRSTPAA